MNVFVGNLSFEITEEELCALFEPFGPLLSAKIVMDGFTNRSRGFGFVDMERDSDAQLAIAALDGTPFNGRPLRVNEARSRSDAANPAGLPSHI